MAVATSTRNVRTRDSRWFHHAYKRAVRLRDVDGRSASAIAIGPSSQGRVPTCGDEARAVPLLVQPGTPTPVRLQPYQLMLKSLSSLNLTHGASNPARRSRSSSARTARGTQRVYGRRGSRTPPHTASDPSARGRPSQSPALRAPQGAAQLAGFGRSSGAVSQRLLTPLIRTQS